MGRSEASGNTDSFSRIAGLTGQTLVVNRFCDFVSPPMSVHHLSHFKMHYDG